MLAATLSPGDLQNGLGYLAAGSASLGCGSRQASHAQHCLPLLQGPCAGSRAKDPGVACC